MKILKNYETIHCVVNRPAVLRAGMGTSTRRFFTWNGGRPKHASKHKPWIEERDAVMHGTVHLCTATISWDCEFLPE